MQSPHSTQTLQNERKEPKEITRLTPVDYAKAGIVRLYDWSVEDREAHDREMTKYRQYLMKLCVISHQIDIESSQEAK
jgi:hypothetical protein